MSKSQVSYRFKVYLWKEFLQRQREREHIVGNGIKYTEITRCIMTQKISKVIPSCVHFCYSEDISGMRHSGYKFIDQNFYELKKQKQRQFLKT